MGVFDRFIDVGVGYYNEVKSYGPESFGIALDMFSFAILIAIAAFVIWKFYNALSKKNFITLNLQKYNWSEHPTFSKFGAVIKYFIEYLIIMPILIMMWFTLLSVILLVIASDRGIIPLLSLSGAMVLAIRILAYYKEDISKDLAKLFPFIALSVYLLAPGTFEVGGFLGNLRELPSLLRNILSFLGVILIVEIVLRVIHTLFELARGKEEIRKDDDV